MRDKPPQSKKKKKKQELRINKNKKKQKKKQRIYSQTGRKGQWEKWEAIQGHWAGVTRGEFPQVRLNFSTRANLAPTVDTVLPQEACPF